MRNDEPKVPASRRKKPRGRFIDNAGHMDPKHLAHLRSLSGAAVVPPDPVPLPKDALADDDLAEALGEGAVSSMTSGEHQRFSNNILDENGLSVLDASDEADIDEVTDAESDKSEPH